MICPCKDCEFRHIGCHAECQPYKDWHAEIKAVADAEKRRRLAKKYTHDAKLLNWKRSHRGG